MTLGFLWYLASPGLTKWHIIPKDFLTVAWVDLSVFFSQLTRIREYAEIYIESQKVLGNNCAAEVLGLAFGTTNQAG